MRWKPFKNMACSKVAGWLPNGYHDAIHGVAKAMTLYPEGIISITNPSPKLSYTGNSPQVDFSILAPKPGSNALLRL